MSGASSFLSMPGHPGPFGALMDEYARAAEDFCRRIEATAPADWTRPVAGRDEDTRSLQAMCAHVVGAARRYADYVRKRRGLEHVDRFVADPASLADAGQVRGQLAEALRYTEGALAGLWEASEETYAALTFPVRWGPTYDPEMLLEHAIVHLLRHRRMIERWPAAGSPAGQG